MSSNADWFRQRLAPPQPQTAVRPLSPLPPTGPVPYQPPPPPAYPQQTPPQQGYPQPVDVPVDEQGNMHVGDVLHLVRNSKEALADSGLCPDCGSPNYFARSSKKVMGNQPAPHCYDCGYNGGLFTQFGNQEG